MEAAALRNRVPRRRAPGFFGFVGAVVIAALAAMAASITDGLGAPIGSHPVAFWIIAALAVLVDARPFSTTGAHQGSAVFPSICFTFALLLGWGLLPAVAAQIAAVVVSSVRLRHVPWRGTFNAAQYALALATAAVILRVAHVPPLSSGPSPGVTALLVFLGAAAAWFVVNQGLVSTAVWLRFGGGWWPNLTRTLVPEALSTLGLLVLAPIVVAAARFSAALVPLMLVPLYAVGQLARSSQETQRKSFVDTLTGLPNRKALFAEIRNARTQWRRPAHSAAVRPPARLALLLLDIDLFKEVNDALGHTVGDRLLGEVAHRLQATVGSDGFVARLGGDEFGVLAPHVADLAEARRLAETIAQALAEPVILDGLPLDVSAAIGIALGPEHGTDHLALLRHADVAMYDAKHRGATIAVYSPESDHNSLARLELLADLRRALENRSDEITLYYQPQVDIVSGEVVGVEALLRWHHPQRGPVDPEVAIKVAEQTAVMRLLTRRVIEEVVGQLAKWRAHGLAPRASINVSVRDLHRPDLVDHLTDLLAELDVPPNQVQFELTEGALMADPRRVLVTLHRLDRLGVALSLDDFGTGYSSLQHLRRLPLAEVKIDRSFVLGMAGDPDDAAVVRSIIELARALGLRVVAEGVEDELTRRMLVEAGCEVAQGWLYARPMPADQLVGWLARYRPASIRDVAT
ncbi:MAG: putative bifunctional diguanylate cyclase/phosphodiesterase [Micromonosporaceae bacterium]